MKRNLPNFLCVGAQKAGTTSLFDLMKGHPDIFLPAAKEIHFFHNTPFYRKGLDRYASYFEDATGHRMIGEFTPEYLHFSEAPARIRESLGPDVKIIILLRDPVQRAYSQFNFFKSLMLEEESDFLVAVDKENVTTDIRPYVKGNYPPYYISKGLYAAQVQRYLDLFGNNVKVVLFEEFFSGDVKKNVCSIFQFLGVSEFLADSNIRANQSKVPRNAKVFGALRSDGAVRLRTAVKKYIPERLYRVLRNAIDGATKRKPRKLPDQQRMVLFERFYKDDVAALEGILGRDLSLWKP